MERGGESPPLPPSLPFRALGRGSPRGGGPGVGVPGAGPTPLGPWGGGPLGVKAQGWGPPGKGRGNPLGSAWALVLNPSQLIDE